MSKRIFQATLSDPDVPDAGAETKDDEEPGKSGDSSSDSDGEQSPLKSSKANEQTGEAMEEDSASDAEDQQKPPSVTAKGHAPGMLMYFCLFLLNKQINHNSSRTSWAPQARVTTVIFTHLLCLSQDYTDILHIFRC